MPSARDPEPSLFEGPAGPSLCERASLGRRHNFDAHFPTASKDDDVFLFFGASSAQVLSTELLAAVCPQSESLQRPATIQASSNTVGTTAPEFESELMLTSIVPTKALILRLIDIYSKSCMVFWPFHIECLADDNVDVFFHSARQQQNFNPQPYTKTEAHTNFQLAMICCIACAHSCRIDMTMSAYEHFFYNFASRIINEVLSEATHDSLRSLMLVIIYLLFRPQKGDVWLQLESACRLAIELGYHREDAPFPETLDQRSQRSHTFWTLYRLEHMIAETYGRPSDDLESISTIPLPQMSMNSPISPTGAANLPSSPDLASSQIRLSLIRSFIFKSIYLPVHGTPLTLDDPYYRVQLHEIEQWHRDATSVTTKPLPGLACTIAYHASVLFLFQKSLLIALSSLADPDMGRQNMVGALAVQSFRSATELINCYHTLILSDSDETKSLSDFPVTLISAQEISVAALTFIACCFCFLEGRVKQENFGGVRVGPTLVQQPWLPLDGNLLRKGEGRQLHRVSASCLSLLTWCSMQWPGMDGMVEIYREISAEVFQRIASKGLA